MEAAKSIQTKKETPDTEGAEFKPDESDVNEEVLSNTEFNESTYPDSYQKGREICKKLNEEMENIDWKENYEKAAETGEQAAEWLNGLFK